jgi:hypothetical protein
VIITLARDLTVTPSSSINTLKSIDLTQDVTDTSLLAALMVYAPDNFRMLQLVQERVGIGAMQRG